MNIRPVRQYINTILNGDEHIHVSTLIFRIFIVLVVLSDIAIILMSSMGMFARDQIIFAIVLYLSAVLFLIEYGLRLWSAPLHYPHRRHPHLKYITSFFGIMDLISVVPFVMPIILIRVSGFDEIIDFFCIFLIFKIARYSKSFHSIADVFRSVRTQLFIAMSIVLLIVAFSGAVMYFIERDAQPEVFDSIGQGFWWAIITFTTVGYGDIYPITPVGKALASFIALIGIGMIALPTGIICSAFMTRINRRTNSRPEEPATSDNEIKYCPHCGKKLRD